MRILKTVAQLSVLLAGLSFTNFALAGQSNIDGSYVGQDLCTRLSAFIPSQRYTVKYPNCDVYINFDYHKTDWAGDEFGSYTYTVRDGDAIYYRGTGTYWLSPRTWKVYFSQNDNYYPRPGVSYAYALVHRNSLTLKTTVRGGTRVSPVRPQILPVH